MSDKQPYLDSYKEEGWSVTRMWVPDGFDLAGGVNVMMDYIIRSLADKYIEEHGAEILKTVAPEQVQKAIEQQVAKKFFGDK